MQITMYTDATPHSVAAIIPTLKMSFAQAFQVPEEINRAEAIALLLGLQWAALSSRTATLTSTVTTAQSSPPCQKESKE